MNRRDFSYLGKELRDVIKHTIHTTDYDKITKDVGDTVNSALESAFVEVRKALNSIQMETQYNRQKSVKNEQNPSTPQRTQTAQPRTSQGQTQPTGSQPPTAQKNQGTSNHLRKVYPNPTGTALTPFPHYPVGKVAGTLQTVFGSIGIGTMGAGVLIFGMLGLSPTILAGLLVLLSGSILLEMNGSTIRNRIKRYKQYLMLFQGKAKCTIEEIAGFSGYSPKFIIKDLKKMIAIGMFPQAHINQEKTLLLLNRESFNEYQKEQAEIKERLLLEAKKDKDLKGKHKKKLKEAVVIEPEVEAVAPVISVFDEGKNYIQQISDAKLAISDLDVSIKVHRIEVTTTKILEHVEKNQEKLPEVRRFMQYYLPTVAKLTNAYHEFEKQPIQGENISGARREIEEALDSINVAFENLFDSLFQSASMNVSADISVLQTMMAQEGLTENDFNVTKK